MSRRKEQEWVRRRGLHDRARRWGTVASLVTLASCTMVGSPGAVAPAPTGARGAASMPDAVPRAEPPSGSGNMVEYRQSGRSYRVLDSSYGYEERGIASWYGEEFHGRPTSSGEPYDMHAMTAAHRTLPLPSWVEVTNLANGRKAILRVNDRGPFHQPEHRIIDVSYAAAVKLGIVGSGTAPVRVRAVEPWQSRVLEGG